LLAGTLYQRILIGTTNSAISYELRDIRTIAPYEGAAGMLLHINGKIEIISFVVKYNFGIAESIDINNNYRKTKKIIV